MMHEHDAEWTNPCKNLTNTDEYCCLLYTSGNNRVDFMDLKISSDYKDNVATATWETLNVPVWPEGKNWNFVESGNIDLSAYKGKKIRIAFVYKSTSDCGPTFEVKNLTLTDRCV